MSRMSTRRKLAIATWSSPREGNIYGKLTLDAGRALEYIDAERARTREKITITHLVGKAVGHALREAPTLNGRIVLGRFVPHRTVDVAFLVSMEDGRDLAKAKVSEIDRKSLGEIARELRGRVERLRRGEDHEFKKSTDALRRMPTWLVRPVAHLSGYLTGAFGLNLPALGLEAFPFGSCIVTNVGVFGLDEGFVPPTPWAHVPLYVLVGAVRDRPAVVDGRLTVRKELTLTATIDHRFIDGFQGAVLARVVKRILENPECLDATAQHGEQGDGLGEAGSGRVSGASGG